MRDYKLTGCFVDDEQKFALIHIYKNASISMRNVLNMRGKYFEWDKIKDKDINTICVIREPIQRLVSAYQYLLRLEDNGFTNKHPIHITKETEFYKNRENSIESFHQFMDYIEDYGFYDAVLLPQTEFLSDRGLTIDDIDDVLIQENMKEDFWNFKQKHNGIEGTILKDNVSDNKISKILNEHIMLNESLILRIRGLYNKDIEMYYKWKFKR